MPVTPAAATAAFARRVALGAFLDGASRATVATALAAAAGLLAARLGGAAPAPGWLWALAVVPIVGFGAWWARARALPRSFAAHHLDRRLGLDGLLLSTLDGAVDPSWQPRLDARLADWRDALPRVQWGALLPRPALAVALVAALAAWPERALPAVLRSPGAFVAAIEDLATRLAAAERSQVLPRAVVDGLAEKLAELGQRAVADSPAAWRELDALAERLTREQVLASLDPARPDGASGNEAGGAEPPGGDAGRGGDAAAAGLAQALAALRAFAGDEQLPAMARTMLESALERLGDDAREVAADPERLRALAESLGGAGGAAAGALEGAGLAPEQRAALRELAASLRDGAADVAARNAVAAGRAGGSTAAGGLGRGPGHVARQLGAPAAGETAMDVALPPGTSLPREWVPAGARTAAPVVAPILGTPTGGGAAAGLGGASWQLQLRPAHRAIVQKFFASGERAQDGR